MKTEVETDQGDHLVIPVPEISPPGGQKSPEDSRKLIQKQLVLLLHAHACQKKDGFNSSENRFKCPVPNCEMMKEVWQHLKGCKVGPDCPHLHCSSSLKILAHWKHCKVWECPVCHLVRLKGAQFTNNPTALSSSPPSSSNEISGQSTKPLLQGQSQCQGQQLPQQNQQQQQQMKPGSELNGGYCYYNCSVRGNTTCQHVDIQQYQQQFKVQQNIQNQSLQFQPPMLMNSQNNIYIQGQNGAYPLQNGIVPGVRGNHRGNLNRKQCQCFKCIGHHDLQQQQQLHAPRNIPQIPGQILRNRKRSADNAFPMEFHMTSRHKSNEAPAPSANDVRRAYEQLGIPCPSDALKRLMATLPGGTKLVLGQEETNDICNPSPSSSDDDDGINVDYTTQDDVPSSSWCLSLVKRLMSNNGHQITAGSS